MGRAYKNFWSLNTDEAVVTGILRSETKKDIEVLMPINAQMKGVDLVLMNLANKKSLTVQVKGSRAYDPQKGQVKKYGEGSAGWFFFSTDVIDKATADYFIFLVYVIELTEEKGRVEIKSHTITIPTRKLQEKVKNKPIDSGNRYKLSFWINPRSKKVIDMSGGYVGNEYSEYLDEKGFEKMNKNLEKRG